MQEELTQTRDTSGNGGNRLSVEFDGSKQFTVKTTLYPDVSNISFALFGQVKQNRGDQGDLMFKGTAANVDYGVYLKGSHDVMRVYYSSSGSPQFPRFSTVPKLDDNSWHTVLIVFDREKQSLDVYLDGGHAGSFDMTDRQLTDDPAVSCYATSNDDMMRTKIHDVLMVILLVRLASQTIQMLYIHDEPCVYP